MGDRDRRTGSSSGGWNGDGLATVPGLSRLCQGGGGVGKGTSEGFVGVWE